MAKTISETLSTFSGRATTKSGTRSTKRIRENSTRLRLQLIEGKEEEEHERGLLNLKGNKLQRAILIVVFFFTFGVVFYNVVEEMLLYEALYFTILTVSTVGYGDVYPKTDFGKVVTCAFVFGGLVLLAESMSIVSDYLMERYNIAARKLAKEAQMKEKEIALQKAKDDVVENAEDSLNVVLAQRSGGAQSPDSSGSQKTKRAKSRSTAGAAMTTLVGGMIAVNKARNTSFLKGGLFGGGDSKDMSDSSNSLSELNTAQAIELETKRLSKKAKKLSPKQLAKEYEELEQRTEMEELARGRWHMVRNVLNILFAVLAGTVFYAVVEDKTWIDALYMSCITVTSVGYGDKKPTTKEGKIFAIFWILSGTLLVGKAIGGYLEFQKEKKQKEIRHRILAKPLSLKEVEMADIDDSKSLSEAEFILYKLQAMGILSTGDVQKVTRKFRVELNPGDGEEVSIPTPEHIETCLRDGHDFNFAMRSYQDLMKVKKKEDEKEEREKVAIDTLNKRKLGKYFGAMHKVRKKLEAEGGDIARWFKEDELLSSLPPLENSSDDVSSQVRDDRLEEARNRLKNLREVDDEEGLDGMRRASTVKANSNVMVTKRKHRDTADSSGSARNVMPGDSKKKLDARRMPKAAEKAASSILKNYRSGKFGSALAKVEPAAGGEGKE